MKLKNAIKIRQYKEYGKRKEQIKWGTIIEEQSKNEILEEEEKQYREAKEGVNIKDMERESN